MKVYIVKESKYSNNYESNGNIRGQKKDYVKILSVYDSEEKAIERLKKETDGYRPEVINRRHGYIPTDLNTGEPIANSFTVSEHVSEYTCHREVTVTFTKTGTRKIYELEDHELE